MQLKFEDLSNEFVKEKVLDFGQKVAKKWSKS